ncbi:uncharacterized protein LOC126633083 [Malus sylvestris]|uniref:uncharacterized protein LOC126633083 n=1 Tax=Malus sylvestris TaxID=3752 RepID=UPI0021AC972F|nr:uncharacterized protein LOC126633083 [Malus sylvestris]
MSFMQLQGPRLWNDRCAFWFQTHNDFVSNFRGWNDWIGVSLDRGQKARDKTRAREQRANEAERALSSTMDIVWGVSRYDHLAKVCQSSEAFQLLTWRQSFLF